MNKERDYVMEHEFFMTCAILEGVIGARAGSGGPFGAVIVWKGGMVGKGHNRVLETKNPTRHAEIEAISNASAYLETYDLSDCILYTSCEPCPMCLGAIMWARIPTVYYASTRAEAAAIGFDDSEFYENLGIGDIKGVELVHLPDESADRLFAWWDSLEDKEKRMY